MIVKTGFQNVGRNWSWSLTRVVARRASVVKSCPDAIYSEDVNWSSVYKINIPYLFAYKPSDFYTKSSQV